MANLAFAHNRQITTVVGIIMGNFGRRADTDALSIAWGQLGVHRIPRLTSPSTLEGGHFFPLSKEVTALGIRLRTEMEGADERRPLRNLRVDCLRRRARLEPKATAARHGFVAGG